MSKVLKQKIQNSELTIGSWISLAHPAIAEIMANAGFDWLVVDLEHSVITIREAEELIRIIDLSGVTPLVRLTTNSPDQIKRVMDAGSHGIIVPMVNSADDAESAISAVRYPPDGNRGVGLARAQGYGVKFNNYFKSNQNDAVVIVQVEHIEAVNNLEEILSVDGVDGYLVGPYDLSCSLGIPGEFDHPEFIETVGKINSVANRLNISGGTHIVEPDVSQLKNKIEEGQKIIAYSVDIRILDHTVRDGLRSIGRG